MIPGRGWFSLFAACFRGGATIFHPYHSCAPVPQNRTSSFPTSGSPISHSVQFRPSIRTQILPDSHSGPAYIGEGL